jgi:hypothetical protein
MQETANYTPRSSGSRAHLAPAITPQPHPVRLGEWGIEDLHEIAIQKGFGFILYDTKPD